MKRSPVAALFAFIGSCFLLITSRVSAQCPDGSPPPCGRAAKVVSAPRTINPNRLAILPFSVRGADPSIAYLGDGLVELLSGEFNGDIGPTAVESGEALRAWSRASKSSEPMTQAAAIRVARELGAGQVTVGSIVGSANRFTVTAQVFSVPGGTAKFQQVQVQGTVDSLPSLIAQLSARLIGQEVGAFNTRSGDPGTSSTQALKAYIEAMAAYRRPGLGIGVASLGMNAPNECPDLCQTVTALDRAMDLDSTFILPAFRQVVLRALNGPTGPLRPVALRTAWSGRAKLSPEQRTLLEVITDGNAMYFRAQLLPRLERAITVLSNSAEAWDLLGDLYFHIGALVGREDWIERARDASVRAIALNVDYCPCSRKRLADIAFIERDAATLARSADPSSWDRYRLALLRNNPGELRTARVEYVRGSMNPAPVPPWLSGMILPRSEADSLIALGRSMANTGDQRRALASWEKLVSGVTGRGTGWIAERAKSAALTVDSARSFVADVQYVHRSLADSFAVAFMWPRIGTDIQRNTSEACELGLARLRTGDTTEVAAVVEALPVWDHARDLGQMQIGLGGPRNAQRMRTFAERSAMMCREVLAGVLESFRGSSAQLLRADSVMQFMPLNWGEWMNHDVALAFAHIGNNARAAKAVRRRWYLAPTGILPSLIALLRDEGRWASAAGDTTAAIRAYREYLAYRSNPDSLPDQFGRNVLIAERDSVRAELAMLERGTRR